MKSSRQLLDDAGFLLTIDHAADVDHLRYTGAVRRRAGRFAAAQRLLMTRANNDLGVRAGRLICLDLIRPSEVEIALKACAYSFRGCVCVCVEWSLDGGKRLDRRALSCVTALCALAPIEDTHNELEALATLLGTLPEYQKISLAERVAELEKDLVCWAALHLPMPLWGHVAGLRPLCALSRSAAAAEETGLVPKIQIDEQSCSRRAEATDMLDVALSASRKAVKPLYLDLAVKAFSMHEDETPRQTLERWMKELLALRARVEAGDVASALIVAWQFDVVESGTVTQVDAACSTRARYVRVASLRLWRMLASLPRDMNQWSVAELEAGYLAMMADKSCSDLAGLGAAISSFQVFLQETFGVPALPLGLHKFIPEPTPRAQWIPLHAIQRAIRWLDEDKSGDPRLKEICALKILIGHAAPVRLNELRWLRLSNLSSTESGDLEIEITPLPGKSGLKSPAATRRILIRDSETGNRILAWIAKRQSEGASLSSILFAAPHDNEKPYRVHAVHTTLLRLLKSATGDSAMTFHALRHTFISNAVEELLSSTSIRNNNRLTQLADVAGHEVVVSSLKFYSHRFEFALRNHLDSQMIDIEMTNADGERVLGIPANTITQNARRAKTALEVCVWRLAAQRIKKKLPSLPQAATGLDMHEPAAITFIGPLARSFSVSNCLDVLRHLASRIDDQFILHRFHISSPELEAINHAAVAVATEIYAARGRLSPAGLLDARTVVQHFQFDIERSNQARYATLRGALDLPLDATIAADAAKAWTSAWWKGNLSADPPIRLVPLLVFLKAATVALDSFVLYLEDDGSESTEVRALSDAANAVATAVFHDHLVIEPVKFVKAGRPHAYLVWPSRRGISAAGKSNMGFDVLMFAVAVWARREIQEWA